MLKSGFYNVLGGGIRLVVALLSLPLMIKLLGTTVYGMYAVISSIAAFVAITESSLLLANTIFITRFGKENERQGSHYSEVINSCLQATIFLSLLLFFLFYTSAFFMAPFFIDNKAQQFIFLTALHLCAGQSALRLLQQFFAGLIQAHHQYGAYNATVTVYSILILGGSILLSYWYPDLRAIFGWQLFIGILFLVYYYHYCRKHGLLPDGMLKLNTPAQFLKPILIHCGRTWPGLLGGVLFAQGDKLIVGRLLGLETVGIYSVLTGVVNQINTFSALPVQPIVAYLRNVSTKISNEYTSVETQNLLSNAISLNTASATGLGLGVICFSPELTHILVPLSLSYSPEKIAALLASLGAIYAIYSMNAVGYYTLFAMHKETLNSVVVLFCGLITVIAIWILAYQVGLSGAVIGNVGYFSSLSLLFIAFQQIKFKRWLLFRFYIVSMLILILALIIILANPLLIIRIGIFVAGCGMLIFINQHYARQLIATSTRLFGQLIKPSSMQTK